MKQPIPLEQRWTNGQGGHCGRLPHTAITEGTSVKHARIVSPQNDFVLSDF